MTPTTPHARPARVLAGLLTASALLCGTVAQPALAAPPVAAPDAARLATLEAESRQQVIRAAEAAASEQARRKHRPPRPDTRAIRDGMRQMVADGAIGVTGRVDAPGVHWSGSAGLRDKDRRAPAQGQDRFRVASITKSMVATLVLQEVEKGTWELDQPVDEVMPGLFPGHEHVTFRQLLSHTSGIPNGTGELLALVEDWSTWDDFLAVISDDYSARFHIDLVNAAPWTEPGEFLYSNAGYIALGLLLEEQNGRSVGELLRQRVWRPAGMRHTSYPDSSRLRGPVLREDAWLGGDEWLELDTFDPDVFGASGAAVSTAADLNRFVDALMEGRLVDRALVEEMMDPVTDGELEYGLGVFRMPDPCSGGQTHLYGHNGATFGTLSFVLSSPDGKRQVSIGATGRDMSSLEGRWDLGTALQPMLLATCGR